MAMTMQIMKNKKLKCKLQYIVVDDEPWFRGLTVAQALEYTNPRKAIRDHVDNDDKRKLSDFHRGGSQTPLTHNEKNSIYINKNGLKSMICKSRMPNASQLAKQFDIDVHGHKYECKESESMRAIMKAFAGEKMKIQHSVLDYRIDLYFPDYNLAIECDENNHSDRDPAEERRRQQRITKKINCQWLRYNPDDKDFNIFQVINQIFTIIKSKA
jgi:very-short-patch-repair endonuclease